MGIDLGTTNCAVCYVDTQVSSSAIQVFSIPQLVAAGQVEPRETLPSFHYQATDAEVASHALQLPWSSGNASACVGVMARDHGRSVPGRLIESAKSWLCHNGIDRRAALLPWHGAEDVQRISPVDASAAYLRHIRDAWNSQHCDAPLEQQEIVLTIPASFDEVARELTVAAARSAGLPRIVLIEEPQAAFYSWVYRNADSWEHTVSPGQKILVCDIGGGTSDFSLIHVRSGSDGRLQFHRVAVGDHLLLGGDNLDLAIASSIEQQLTNGGRLELRQWSVLVPACRHAKELLLSADAPHETTIVLPGSGSRLIGGSLQVTISADEIRSLVLDGFLPPSRFDERPQRRQSGFQEFGLPYAADAGITRYLAAFLNDSSLTESHELKDVRPDIVLFNGGFFASDLLRERLVERLTGWFSTADEPWEPVILQNDRLDLAVARGAAYFGMVRRGSGVRIVAGLARTYYIGVEQPDGALAALCLISAGSEPTAEAAELPMSFDIRTAEPVEFSVFVSATRLNDRPGQLVPIDRERMQALPPIRTVLTTRQKHADHSSVTAHIAVRLTEIGTLELWCRQVDGNRRWQLQFDIRAATETDRTAHSGEAEKSGIVDDDVVSRAQHDIREVFKSGATVTPDGLPKRIARNLGISRSEWPPSLLRAMWAQLIDLPDARRRSAVHEQRWLNLAGFCLRPGFGMAADDWRVEETWKALKGRIIHGDAATLAEWRILCRRIAGGLTAGQQTQLAASILPLIRARHRQVVSGRGKAPEYATGSHEASEIWRMLASFELLDQKTRIELADIILTFLGRPAFEAVENALIWSIGRIGARIPVYGPLNLVIPVRHVSQWIVDIVRRCDLSGPGTQLTLMQLSRRTNDRFRDIDEELRAEVLQKLKSVEASGHLLQLISEGGELEADEAGQILGESLPSGLRLQSR
ncbi:MAG: Hsp70 family protein [Planctomycetaceae bacterium]|nr:Hsp70 family protein [Planctomycetaceae bacterium]